MTISGFCIIKNMMDMEELCQMRKQSVTIVITTCHLSKDCHSKLPHVKRLTSLPATCQWTNLNTSSESINSIQLIRNIQTGISPTYLSKPEELLPRVQLKLHPLIQAFIFLCSCILFFRWVGVVEMEEQFIPHEVLCFPR